MAYTDIIQSINNAMKDASTLGDCINGEPDKKVKSRLGREYWTLATADKKLGELANAINTALANGAGQNGWVASLIKDNSGKTQQQINTVLEPLTTMIRKSIAKQGADDKRAMLDIYAQNDTNTFIDNVLTIQNRTTNGVQYGNAAYAFLDGAGNERGAIGYSRNSSIQPDGYYPDSMFIECGDPFVGDNNPSDFRLIVTLNSKSPYFAGTSYNVIHHQTKTGKTTIRGRSTNPADYALELDANTAILGNARIGSKTNVRELAIGMQSSMIRLRERNAQNKFAITANVDSNGVFDDPSIDAWEMAMGNGSMWIGRLNPPDNTIFKPFFIDNTNRVMMGVQNYGAGYDGKVIISSDGIPTALSVRSTSAAQFPAQIIYHAADSGDNCFLAFGVGSSYAQKGFIGFNRSAGTVNYATTSDYRAKTVQGDYDNALATLNELHVVNATMNGATQNAPMFIAHELQAVCSYAVTGEKDAVDDEGNPIYQQVDSSKLVPLLVKAVQELQEQVNQLSRPA